MPVSRRIEKLKNVLDAKLKVKKDFIKEQIEYAYEAKKERLKKQMPDSDERRAMIIEILDERDKKLKGLKKTLGSAIKDYIATFKFFKTGRYYGLLYERPSLVKSLAQDIFTDGETEILINEKNFTTDDLAPYLYIHHRMRGNEDSEFATQPVIYKNAVIGYAPAEPLKHVVIDEAQDFSPFQLWAMKEVCADAYFSILGDLNQGIYSYRGVEKWDAAYAIYKNKNPVYTTLKQSYRTTVEIMDAANDVIGRLEGRMPKANPVIRHGPPVTVTEVDSLEHAAARIDEIRASSEKKGYRSFAVICKTLAECRAFKKELKSKTELITGKEQTYEGGCLIVPAYLIKGLEFDVCVVADASAENFKDNELDVKLLYIAMTRALHELIILSVGEKTSLLSGLAT